MTPIVIDPELYNIVAAWPKIDQRLRDVLASLVDGVVLVVRAGGPQEDDVQRVTELLGRKRLLGVVLNDARGI